MFLYLLGLLHLILFLIAAFEILAGGKPLLHKILWLLLIFLFPLGGLIIYYIFGRGS